MRRSFISQLFRVLLVWVALSSGGTFAEPLTPDEKAAIEAQQADAQRVSETLQQRIACYAATDNSLQSESETLQKLSAQLHKEQIKLNTEVDANQELLNGFEREYEQVQRDVKLLESSVNDLETSVARKIATINQCRRDAGIFAFACDVYHELFGVSNQLRNQQNALKALNRHRATVNSHLREAQNRYDRANTQYKKIATRVNDNEKSLNDTNAQISKIKKTLKNMRVQEQVYAKARSGFNNALAQLEGKDLNTDRRYYQRKLREASQELSEKTKSISEILRQEIQLFPDGSHVCNS